MLKAQGKNKEAKEMYLKALGINPQYKDALNNLGSVYQSLNEYDEAIKCYD